MAINTDQKHLYEIESEYTVNNKKYIVKAIAQIPPCYFNVNGSPFWEVFDISDDGIRHVELWKDNFVTKTGRCVPIVFSGSKQSVKANDGRLVDIEDANISYKAGEIDTELVIDDES